jgi:hypothetical protein
VDKLQKGMYVHIYDLIRQPRLSSNPLENRSETQIADGIFLSDTTSKKKRTVNNPLDYFEVLFSSILPVQTQLVQQAPTLAHAKQHADTLQKLMCFALSAVVNFRRYTFIPVLKYLEAHRETNLPSNENIDVQDINKFHLMVVSNQHINQPAPSHSSDGRSSSSSTTSNPHGRRQKGFPKDDSCGNFNSKLGCKLATCAYLHVCRLCRATSHGKPGCPKFRGNQTKETSFSITNTHNRK